MADAHLPSTSGPAVSASVSKLIQSIREIPVPEEQTQPMPNESFDTDLVVIGSGPGGYYAAIRAAQLGAKVTCVEKAFLGGTCLNVGCVPSKALIASVERLHQVKTATKIGLKLDGEAIPDSEAIYARKQKIVETQRGGIGILFKKNKVSHVEGFASFVDKHTIEVEKDGKKTTIRAKNFIIASGSSVVMLPIPGLEGGRDAGVWTSDDAVSAPFVPKKMVVLGGGAVGCEFSYVFNGLGSEVHLVEMMPTLLPLMDEELGKELGKQLGRSGIKVTTGATIEKVEKAGKGWKVFVKKGTETETLDVDVILLGVGRKANTDGMNLEKIGVKLHRRGIEVVDDTLRTHVDNIYAIGDVTGRIQLAHVAEHEGLVAATNIVKGENHKMDYKAVPNCVYTYPEVSSVGLTEGQAKEQGYDVVVGKANFRPFAKAMATLEQEGFVKVVAEKKYGEVLGVHMIGAHVTDMIHESVIALTHEATLESINESIHAHPTMSEAIAEAFEDAVGLAIHKI